jgi:X-Pro dipeptidyl-peptidase
MAERVGRRNPAAGGRPYHDEADWPASGTRWARLYLSARSATAPGELSTNPRHGSRDQSFVDRSRELDTDDVLITNPDSPNPNRLVHRSPELRRDVRISGIPWVTLQMSVDNRNDADPTAVLVDYGPAGPLMVTRGWLDPQNRLSISRSTPIKRRLSRSNCHKVVTKSPSHVPFEALGRSV